jgi:hypothetical protein
MMAALIIDLTNIRLHLEMEVQSCMFRSCDDAHY